MPVVAVLGAVAIDGFALAGGIAAMSTLTAITAIGATLGAVGAVTHNKTLTMIGAGLGIVGGIGTLAMGSGALGTVGDLFGSSAADEAAGASLGASAGAGADAVTESINAGTSGAMGADTANIVSSTGALDMSSLPTGVINSVSSAAEGNPTAIMTGGDTGSALGQSLSPSITRDTATASWEPGTRADAFAPGADATGGATAPMSQYNSDFLDNGFAKMSADNPPGGTLDKLFGWATKDPRSQTMLAYGVLQAGGSFITGLTNPMTQPQIDKLNSEAEANRATAALLQRQTANQGAALPTVSFASPSLVTGAPERSSGLINNAPVGTPLITGAPNLAGMPTLTGNPANPLIFAPPVTRTVAT